MVVVALLSVDLVESVDLVSVVLVVNCTWYYLSSRQINDSFQEKSRHEKKIHQ